MGIWQRLTTIKNLKRIFFTFLIGFIPMGVIVALLTPDDILSNALARHFTDFVSGLIPIVRETGRRTTVPATHFIAAVLNCVAIGGSMVLGFAFIVMERGHTYDEENIEIHKNLQKQHPFKYFFGLIVGPLILLSYILMMNIEPFRESLTYREKTMLGSKAGMACYGVPYFFCLWLTAVMMIFTIYNTISTQYRIWQRKRNNG